MSDEEIGPIEEVPHTPRRGRGPAKTGRAAALRAMEVGQSRLFLLASRHALGSICHQVLGPGNYSIRKEGAAFRVYRLGIKDEEGWDRGVETPDT
jgi:hypothetical protein